MPLSPTIFIKKIEHPATISASKMVRPTAPFRFNLSVKLMAHGVPKSC